MAKETRKKKPFRLRVRNRSLSFTPLGTRFLIVCVLIGIAAINTGSNLLYLCTAMMLSMVIVSGILSEQALRKLGVSRRLPDEIYAGEPFTARYTVENGKRRIPSFALSVAGLSRGSEHAAAFMLRLAPGGSGEAAGVWSVPTRGRWLTDGYQVSTRFPFGLFRKSIRLPASDEMTVYPPIRDLPSGIPRSITRGQGEAPSGRVGQGAELRSLRDYREHDEARLIHWKSSARLSRLLVKELEAEQKRTVTIILDDMADGAPAVFAEAFEEAVALAAAAARSLLMEHDVPVAFISRGFNLPAGAGRGQYLAVMDGLSLIAPIGRASDEAERSAGEALRRALSGGPCVMVFASRESAWSGYAGHAQMVLEARP